MGVGGVAMPRVGASRVGALTSLIPANLESMTPPPCFEASSACYHTANLEERSTDMRLTSLEPDDRVPSVLYVEITVVVR